MNKYTLNEAVGLIDTKQLERGARVKKRRRLPVYFGAVAALLAAAIIMSTFFGSSPSAFAVSEAVYPKMAKINSFNHRDYLLSIRERSEFMGHGEELSGFYERLSGAILGGREGENAVFSPLCVYMALGMLAESAAGRSRQQILDAIGAESIEALREQAYNLWNANYRDTGAVKSVLASSVWLSEDVYCDMEGIKRLSDNYYASVYKGDMTSESFNSAYRRWLDRETDGLLTESVKDKAFVPDCVMSILCTVSFNGKWAQAFAKENTKPGVFHSPEGDVTVDFMHKTELNGGYFWGEKFSAISVGVKDDGSMMYLILPDEGFTPADLLADEEAAGLIYGERHTLNSGSFRVIMSIPRFDVGSTIDISDALMSLGITDVFSMNDADFSSVFDAKEPVYVDKAEHGSRLVFDEDGVKAASYVEVQTPNSAPPPSEEVEFTLDRPFIFVLKNNDRQPLFIGTVNCPG